MGFFSLDEAQLLVHPKCNYPHLRKDLDSVQTLTVHADHTILEPKTQTLNKSLRLLELTTDLEAHHPMEEKEVPE